MIRYFLATTIILMSYSSGISQDFFSNNYNLIDEAGHDHIIDMDFYEDKVYIVAQENYCPDIFDWCVGLAVADLNGNVETLRKFPEMERGGVRKISVSENEIIVSGKERYRNTIFLYKMNLSGDSLLFVQHKLSEIEDFNLRGAVQTDEHYVYYGNTVIDSSSTGYLVWLNKNGTIDTTTIDTSIRFIHQADIDSNGFLTLLYTHSNTNNDHEKLGVKKLNSEGAEVSNWISNQPISIYNLSRFHLTPDNFIYITTVTIHDHSSTEIWKLTPNYTIEWTYSFNPQDQLLPQPTIYRLKEFSDGNIICAGNMLDISQNLNAGFMCSFSPDGNLKWERLYSKELEGDTLLGTIYDIEETEQGNIIAGGKLQHLLERDYSWLMYTDDQGCFQANCENVLILNTLDRRTKNDHCAIELVNSIASNRLQISAPPSDIPFKQGDYMIFTTNGQKVLAGKHLYSSDTEIDISPLSNGVHFIVFYSNDGMKCTKKFVKF